MVLLQVVIAYLMVRIAVTLWLVVFEFIREEKEAAYLCSVIVAAEMPEEAPVTLESGDCTSMLPATPSRAAEASRFQVISAIRFCIRVARSLYRAFKQTSWPGIAMSRRRMRRVRASLSSKPILLRSLGFGNSDNVEVEWVTISPEPIPVEIPNPEPVAKQDLKEWVTVSPQPIPAEIPNPEPVAQQDLKEWVTVSPQPIPAEIANPEPVAKQDLKPGNESIICLQDKP